LWLLDDDADCVAAKQAEEPNAEIQSVAAGEVFIDDDGKSKDDARLDSAKWWKRVISSASRLISQQLPIGSRWRQSIGRKQLPCFLANHHGGA
jgi:hypothetical protein